MMIGCACTELFGQRPPTADLLVTITMGLVTLFLINYYGIKEKGLGGRIRSMGGTCQGHVTADVRAQNNQ